ncbi:AAA family ATPase [Anaerolineales bacterium HSG25]|nr:AAA family ATPase [Anaerolineales bacterium HSG25]
MKKRSRVMRTLYDSMEYIDIGSDLKVRLLGFDLAGFKAFQELTYIPINPITVLVGLNSRGKSSVIQALLLLKQTLLAEKRVGGRITLDWDGSFFQVHQIEEMIYNQNDHGTFSFGFLSYCKTDEQYPTTVLGIISSDLSQFFVKTTFMFHTNLPDESALRLDVSFEVIDESENRLLTVTVTEVADSDNVRIKFYFDNETKMNRIFFTEQIQYSYFMPMWNSSIPKFDASSQEFEVFRYSSVYHGLFHPILKAIQTELINNLKYVGPLREEPQRSYINRRIRGDDIGAIRNSPIRLISHPSVVAPCLSLPRAGQVNRSHVS